MANDTANEVLAAWETSSQYWNKHQALIEMMYAPLSRALIEDAHIGSGQTVLDVGGGSGEPWIGHLHRPGGGYGQGCAR